MIKIAGIILLVCFIVLSVWGFMKGWKEKDKEL